MNKESRDEKSKFTIKRIVLFIVVIVISILVVETVISYHWIKVNEYSVSAKEIQSPVRLVVISDLHAHKFGSDNGKLVDKVKDQEPDVILMCGDFLNEDSDNHTEVIKLVEKFKNIAPVYFAPGNHELGYIENGHEEFLEDLETAGAVVLDKTYKDITVGKTHIRLGGLYDYAFALDGNDDAKNTPEPVKSFLLEYQETQSYKIMMSHRPDSFIFGNASEYWDVDLVISGHNHGGQVVVPFLGGLFGGDQGLFPKYIHGMYDVGAMKLFATSGLSSERQMLPRWNNRPEIAMIELSAEDN